jgi:penicillin-binding protein 1A
LFYTKIVDRDGNILLNNKPEKKTVMKESTAFLLTSAMEDVVKKGTGTLCKLSTNMPVAGKTGTTTKNVDLWFAGYTPYYTMTIWSGFDNNQPQIEKTYHKKLWRKIMDEIDKKMDLQTETFPMPDSIVTRKICSKSGKLAVDGLCDCSADPYSKVYMEYFAKGTEPTEYCDVHRKVSICTQSKKLATKGCPQVKDLVLLVKTETGRTLDSPYVVPTEECPLHAGFLDNIFNKNDPKNQQDNDNNDGYTDEQGQDTTSPDDPNNPDNGNNGNNGDNGDNGNTNGNTDTQNNGDNSTTDGFLDPGTGQ